jgi:hypothetical protein
MSRLAPRGKRTARGLSAIWGTASLLTGQGVFGFLPRSPKLLNGRSIALNMVTKRLISTQGPKQRLLRLVFDLYREFAALRAGQHILGHIGKGAGSLIAGPIVAGRRAAMRDGGKRLRRLDGSEPTPISGLVTLCAALDDEIEHRLVERERRAREHGRSYI